MIQTNHGTGAPSPAAQMLINAAERLIGERGLGRVSLRQIGQAAGQGNNYAVQYHFGDVGGLVRAVLRSRIPPVEEVRARMVSELRDRGELGDTKALMNALYLPLIDHGGVPGERHYARFVLALQSSPDGLPFALEHNGLMPVSAQILDLLHQATPRLPPALVSERQRLISFMVLTSVLNRLRPYQSADYDRALIDNVLDMATAAFLAPVPPSTAAMLRDIGTPEPRDLAAS